MKLLCKVVYFTVVQFLVKLHYEEVLSSIEEELSWATFDFSKKYQKFSEKFQTIFYSRIQNKGVTLLRI